MASVAVCGATTSGSIGQAVDGTGEQRQTGRSSEGYRADGGAAHGHAPAAVDKSRRRDRGTESPQSDGLGRTNLNFWIFLKIQT